MMLSVSCHLQTMARVFSSPSWLSFLSPGTHHLWNRGWADCRRPHLEARPQTCWGQVALSTESGEADHLLVSLQMRFSLLAWGWEMDTGRKVCDHTRVTFLTVYR